jgi:transposase-like protein
VSGNDAQRQARDGGNADRNARPAQAWTDAQKAQALQRADEVGAAAAARELGIPAATIRSWRLRSGKAGPPSGADPVDWAERKRAGAEEAWETAQEALAEVKRLLKTDKTADAQRAALTMAILTDKSGVLELAAAQADARRAELAQEDAKLVVELIERVLRDLGIRFHPGSPVAKLFGAYLRDHVAGAAPETVEAARREVRAQLLADVTTEELAEHLPQLEAGEPQGPLALLAPSDDQSEQEAADEMIGPKTIVRTFRERRSVRNASRRRGSAGSTRQPDSAEVIEGEIVEGHVRRLQPDEADQANPEAEMVPKLDDPYADPSTWVWR